MHVTSWVYLYVIHVPMTWFQVTRYPVKLLSVMADKSVDTIGKQGTAWVMKLIPFHQIYMVIMFFLYSLISIDLLMFLVPLLFFYVTFIAMSVTTMQMFYSKRKQKDVSTIASLLSRFNDALDNDSAVSAYAWESLRPYLVFFVCLAVNVAMFAIADKTWIPCPELTCLSAVFCGTCFYALSDAHDNLLTLAIIMDLISKSPKFVAALPNVPIIKPCLVLLTSNWLSFDIAGGLQCSIDIPSLAMLIVPLLFVKMLTKHSWTGWYRVLIPHLVCFFWWQLAGVFFPHSTWSGLLRASVGWLSFVFLLPVAVIVSLGYVLKTVTSDTVLQLFVTFVLLLLPVLIGVVSQGGFKSAWLKFKGTGVVKKILPIMAFVIMVAMLFLHTPIEQDVQGKYVTWEQYSQYCSQPMWDQSNIANAQQLCSHLKHSHVDWSGTVKKIVVKETKNTVEDFLNNFPFWITEPIRCAYGEPYASCDAEQGEDDKAVCELLRAQARSSCHLKNMDIYLFEIWVEMSLVDKENNPTTQDIRIEASHWFKNSLRNISAGDQISFRAALKSSLGDKWPVLSLFHFQCDEKNIRFGSKTLLSETSWRIVETIQNGTFASWNFLFAPLLQFK